jgi:xanthine dehydrogenase accessory factor
LDSVDLAVLNTLQAWRATQATCWLATVVQTFGSSPRPPGAMLVLRADGLLAGSVSGGCIEDDLAERARLGSLPMQTPEVLTYGVTREEARRFGLPCGGTLGIVVEPVTDYSWVGELLLRIGRHELVARRLDMLSGKVTLADAARDVVLCFDGNALTTVHGPRWRLLIIGAGQTSCYLARMAQALDYQVMVCDPREEFRQAWDVPGAALLPDMPDDAVVAFQPDTCTAIIALTHDPKLDDMALLEALKSPAFYIGALGSRATNARRRERLALFDLTPEEIDRLHGPVGLDIGSRTPPEIAIAILAHLISLRNRKPQSDASCITQPIKLEMNS